ncbi:MAG: SRPBCC family protein, partial [Flavobacteriales bacterium]|nr:SRPBCC family protein [Flavobacteriales bacterium]
MKFQSEIDIELGMEEVIGIFEKPENTMEWLEGLRSIELISGNAGEEGSKNKVIFESALGRMEIIETIKVTNLPEEYGTTYEGVGYFSWSRHCFVPLDENRT